MSKFTVVKSKDHPYLLMDKTGLQDVRLSRKAKGLLAYLLSLPDDWEIYLSDLQNRSRDGRDGTASGVDELLQHGYLDRKQRHEKDGKFAGYDYDVYEQPKPEKPYTEKPETENPTLLNNISSYIRKDTTNICIDNIIYDRVYITNKEYDILIYKYNIESVNKNIISLNKYLENPKNQYSNHYLTLNKRLKKSKDQGKLSIPVSEEAKLIYKVIKKYALRVDGTEEQCEHLKIAILDTYPGTDTVQFVDGLIKAMIKTGQAQYYSIADPVGMTKKLGTLISKLRMKDVDDNKPTTVSFKDGMMIVS